jgi:hypothetical protein
MGKYSADLTSKSLLGGGGEWRRKVEEKKESETVVVSWKHMVVIM